MSVKKSGRFVFEQHIRVSREARAALPVNPLVFHIENDAALVCVVGSKG